jgi:phage/plasmid-like protein (TIGR03299 family)
MSHEIRERDTVISVRDAGWHGLAKVLADHVTPEEARQQAFPWEPVTTPIYRAVPVVTESGDLETTYEEIPDLVGVERSDSGEFFGTVSREFGETLAHTNNKALTEIAESVEGLAAGEVRVETAGSLMNGRKVWMLLRLNEPVVLAGKGLAPEATATLQYFALQTRHDGKGALRGQALSTRIICDNTAQAADLEAAKQGTEFTFRHTSGIADRIEEAKGALAMWRQSIEEWKALMDSLLDLRITAEQRKVFVDTWGPTRLPDTGLAVSERVMNNIEVARGEFAKIMTGITTAGVDDTAYGLVQAAIEFQQHVRSVRAADDVARAESRFKRAYLDRDNMIEGAVALARKVAVTA